VRAHTGGYSVVWIIFITVNKIYILTRSLTALSLLQEILQAAELRVDILHIDVLVNVIHVGRTRLVVAAHGRGWPDALILLIVVLLHYVDVKGFRCSGLLLGLLLEGGTLGFLLGGI
jgi:hypothetical protein